VVKVVGLMFVGIVDLCNLFVEGKKDNFGKDCVVVLVVFLFGIISWYDDVYFDVFVGLSLLLGLLRMSRSGFLSSVVVMLRCWCMLRE